MLPILSLNGLSGKAGTIQSGDNIGFLKQYKINPTDPDEPCDDVVQDEWTQEEEVDLESGRFRCFRDITIEDHYEWTQDAEGNWGYHLTYTVVRSTPWYDCDPIEYE